VVSLVSPYKDQRENFKSENQVTEIYVHTTEIRGREHFAVNDYDPPTENYLDLDTTNQTIEETTNKLLNIILP
jgi:adenylylsulfate kinase-like enzyme